MAGEKREMKTPEEKVKHSPISVLLPNTCKYVSFIATKYKNKREKEAMA